VLPLERGIEAYQAVAAGVRVCQLGAEAIVSKKVDGACFLARAASGSRPAIPPASPCSGSGARFGIDERGIWPPAPAMGLLRVSWGQLRLDAIAASRMSWPVPPVKHHKF
jgi:hypothetical protein